MALDMLAAIGPGLKGEAAKSGMDGGDTAVWRCVVFDSG